MRPHRWTGTARAVRLTRVFDAPCHLVQEVLSHPEHRRHWWGPTTPADAGTSVTILVTDEGRRTRVTVTIHPPSLVPAPDTSFGGQAYPHLPAPV